MKIEWIDSGREPKIAPDPRYPTGKHLTHSMIGKHCLTELPYPAKRCGYFIVECETCKTRIIITTAGRPDDPRSVEVPCKSSK